MQEEREFGHRFLKSLLARSLREIPSHLAGCFRLSADAEMPAGSLFHRRAHYTFFFFYSFNGSINLGPASISKFGIEQNSKRRICRMKAIGGCISARRVHVCRSAAFDWIESREPQLRNGRRMVSIQFNPIQFNSVPANQCNSIISAKNSCCLSLISFERPANLRSCHCVRLP